MARVLSAVMNSGMLPTLPETPPSMTSQLPREPAEMITDRHRSRFSTNR